MSEMRIHYGAKVMQPQMGVTLVPTPPETPQERGIRVAKRIGWSFLCLVGAATAILLWALLTTLIHAPALAGLGGIVVGSTAFVVWSSGRV